MNAENQTQTSDPTPGVDEHRRPKGQQGTARCKIAQLLAEVDQQALSLRQKIAELLAEEDAYRQMTSKKDSLEALVGHLREANQNLVLAAFSAQDMQAQAEATYRRQEEFLSMLAHELRNPLAPISVAVEILGTLTDAHPQLPKLHEIIDRQTEHLIRLVDDLMDASRVNSGKITLKKSALLISEVIESAVETSKPFIDERQQRFSVDLPSVPIVIEGDLVRLGQLFSNLLINATKFTQEGGKISLTVSQLSDTVLISVKDNGVGIAPDLQPYIFDLFAQGPRSLDRSQGGMGIGLSLVRSIAAMHGGTAQVFSEGTGQGSEFFISIPISEKLPMPEKSHARNGGVPEASTAGPPQRILIIDDNADGNEILSKLLTQYGHATQSAFNGIAGLEMATSSRYDVILCDVGLPGMNGYEVVRRLRQHTAGPLPLLIAMTGYNQESHRARATDAGFDHYLVKPIVTSELAKLLSSRIS